MRICLFGIGGVYNYGCEAIVRGSTAFIKMLEQQFSGMKMKFSEKLEPSEKLDVVYYSFNYEYDCKRLSDLGIEVVPVQTNRTFIKRVQNKIMRMTHYEGCKLFYDYEKIIDDTDMFFFIGGDILTIPTVFREQEKYSYVNNLVEFGKKAIKKGKPVILYGASVGPFGHYNKAVNYYKKALKSYRAILCREDVTMAYLRSLGLNNIMFFLDPAFLVELSDVEWFSKKENENDVERNAVPINKPIGINLSPLSLNELYQGGNESQIGRMAELLERIRHEFGRDILLVPHVISSNPNDNDAEFMEKILDTLKDAEKEHYRLADYSGGFLGIKKQLRNCEIVVSARMHCAINAIHENIPTILLSYSQKSIGMCKYVYGSDEWVVDIRKADDELLPKMREMFTKYKDTQLELKRRNNEIKHSLCENVEAVKLKIFSGYDL